MEEGGRIRKSLSDYPVGGDFRTLLGWHFDWGTRPTGSPCQPGSTEWSPKAFAKKIGASDKVVRNWLLGKNRPRYLEPLEQSLFGDNLEYRDWRLDFRRAFKSEPFVVLRGEVHSAPATTSIPLAPPSIAHATLEDLTANLRLPAPLTLEGAARAIDPSLAVAILSRISAGNRGFIQPSIYNPSGKVLFNDLMRRVATDLELRRSIIEFAEKVEKIWLEQPLRDADPLYFSAAGRAYIILAHAIGRI